MAERWTDYMSVADLPEAPVNPKAHDEQLIEDSFRRFGYVEPITLDERTGRIVSGHGRKKELLRAQAAGETPPDGVQVGDDGVWQVPVSRGWTSRDDDEAAAYVIAANQIGPKGGWHDDLLAEELSRLAQFDDGLVGLGYSDDDLAELLALTGPPNFQPTSEDAQPRLDVRNPVVCPSCGHSFHRV